MPSFIRHASYSQSSMQPDILYGECSIDIIISSSQPQRKAVWTPGAIGHIVQCPTTAHGPIHPSYTVGNPPSLLPHLPCQPTAAQRSIILPFPPFQPRIPPSLSAHHPALYAEEIIWSTPSQEQLIDSIFPRAVGCPQQSSWFPIARAAGFPSSRVCPLSWGT
jgi:hypothetical protein